MRFGAVLFWIMAAALIWNRVQLTRRAKRSQEIVDRVYAFLMCLALHWGEPAEQVRAELIKIMDRRSEAKFVPPNQDRRK